MRNQRTIHLRIEPLERRELLAADGFALVYVDESLLSYGPQRPAISVGESTAELPVIIAVMIDGVLTIRGDAADSYLEISGPRSDVISSQPGGHERYALYAHGSRIADWPSYNGYSSAIFENVTAIDIDLGDGDDELRIRDSLTVPLTLRTGAGDDQILIRGNEGSSVAVGFNYYSSSPSSLPMQGDLFIDTGDGNDQLTIDAEVKGNATVLMGDGDDFFTKLIDESPFSQGQYIGVFSASGNLTVDLGAGQDIENIPADWRDDPQLAFRLNRQQDVLLALDLYRGLVERGEATPGTEQLIELPGYQSSVRVDAAGRLEVNFSFTPGYERVIDRLRARGVVLEAYTFKYGGGRALIREVDLKLFANLPGLGYLTARSYYPAAEPSIVLTGFDANPYDFVLPGTTTAEEVANIPPSRDFGPPRLEDVPDNANQTLEESYYRNRPMGPQLLFK